MKFKDYLSKMNELAETMPEVLEMDVVFSIDDEGNAFNPVHWGPSVGLHEGRDFIPNDMLGEDETPNAVCLN